MEKEFIKVFAIVCSFIIFSCNTVTKNSNAADTVFTNGKIYTVNTTQPWAETLAIKDNKIVYVGTTIDAKEFIGVDTKTTNLKGKMVLPGFISGHDHLVASNWTSNGVSLFGATNKKEVLKRIKNYAEKNPNEKVIFGFGWNKEMFEGQNPTAIELDNAISDRPAMIFDFTVHDLWFNSLALNNAGVDKNSKDGKPGFSYWVRDENNNPTGTGIEMIWQKAFIASGYWNVEETIEKSLKYYYDEYAKRGWTSFINQGLLTPTLTDLPANINEQELAYKHLQGLEAKGELKLRTFLKLFYKNPNDDVALLVNTAVAHGKKYNSDKVRGAGIKIHPEGNWITHTSLMQKPFSDKNTHGHSGISPERVKEIILLANKQGIDVSIHSDGSSTNKTTLDAFETSFKQGNTDSRNSMQHFVNVTPEDQQRVADLNIAVNFTPIWATNWADGMELAVAILGEERLEKMYQPIRTAFDKGVNVSISSDTPSTTIEESGALVQLESAITLTDPSNPNGKAFLGTDKAINLEQGIMALTIYPAWQARMEDKIGSIEVGKFADLVILEKNLFEVKPSEIADVKILYTIMDGEYTFKNVSGENQN